MSAIDSLKADLKEVHHYPLALTQVKALNTLDEAVDIVLKYDDQISAAANKYNVPKEMVQAIIFREQATLGIDDPVADSLVIDKYTIGVGRPDCSTGIGQVFAKTAINAEIDVNKNYSFNPENPKDIWTVWQNLQDPTYNIEHVAMVLKMEANRKYINLEKADNLEIRDVLASYNGTGDGALRYGCDTVAYIPVFKNYNLGITNGVDWDMGQQLYTKSDEYAVGVALNRQNAQNVQQVNSLAYSGHTLVFNPGTHISKQMSAGSISLAGENNPNMTVEQQVEIAQSPNSIVERYSSAAASISGERLSEETSRSMDSGKKNMDRDPYNRMSESGKNSVDNSVVTQVIQGHDVWRTVNELKNDNYRECKDIKDMLKPALTQEQIRELAQHDYTKGESTKLKAQYKALDSELAGINANRERVEKLGENLGICKYLPDFAIRRINQLKLGDVYHYEEETEKLKERCKDYDKRNNEHNAKVQEMQMRLNTPEAQAFIDQRIKEYTEKEQARQEKSPELEARLAQLQKEDKAIGELEKTLPLGLRSNYFEIKGDPKDPHNILSQTDQIKEQVEPMLQQQYQMEQSLAAGVGLRR